MRARPGGVGGGSWLVAHLFQSFNFRVCFFVCDSLGKLGKLVPIQSNCGCGAYAPTSPVLSYLTVGLISPILTIDLNVRAHLSLNR